MARRLSAPAVAIGAAGVLLAAAALMSLVGAMLAQPADETLTRLRERAAVEPRAAAAAGRASLRAAAWFEPSRYLTDAALALSAAGGERGAKVATVAARALAEQPAAPHNWARVAIARRDAGDLSGAMAAWEMSVLSGRYVPGLMGPRLELGLGLIAAAGPDQVALIGEQVRLVAALDPGRLAISARRARAEPFVRAALVSAPDLRAAYAAARGAKSS